MTDASRKLAQRYLNSGGFPPGFDFFDVPEPDEVVVSPVQALATELGELEEYRNAREYLKPEVLGLIGEPKVFIFRRNRSWAVELEGRLSESQALRLGKRVKAGLIGVRSLNSSHYHLRDFDLYVAHRDGERRTLKPGVVTEGWFLKIS
jgi:hypothetical protein